MCPDDSPPPARSQFALLKTRRFAPFFVTQFLGAFNDNLFKNALVVLLTFHAAGWTALAPEILSNLAAGLFILPFFLFSATAGQLADKYDKARLARLVKGLEMAIMGIAALGFFLHSLAVLLGALFLLGLHSTLFGPVKYAILPQHLHADELVGGNALVESGTFVAILLGTLAGGLLAGTGGSPVRIALAGLALAAMGYLASRRIPSAPAPEPQLVVNLNPFSETRRNIGFARHNRTVFLAILGISWFWLFGALFLAQFPVFAKNVLGGDEALVTLLLSVFTVGIGAGSLLCEKLSGKSVEPGLIPLGAIGLTLFGLDLFFASPAAPPLAAPLALKALLALPELRRVLFDLFAIGLSGGLFIVPLYVLLQTGSDPMHRARIIAANNILNALFMVAGALAAASLLALGTPIPALFALAALGNVLVIRSAYRQYSGHFLRFLGAILIHSVYRLEKRGLENIPDTGAALLICNHVSYADPVVIAAACRRPIRFVMDHRIFRMPVIRFFFRQARAIPIAPAKEDPACMEAAFEAVAQALDAGELVCIFPEGGLTPNGEIAPFRRGLERIVTRSPVPVVPMALRGLWGSLFSRKEKTVARRLKAFRPFPKIGLFVGTPVRPETASADQLQHRVRALGKDY